MSKLSRDQIISVVLLFIFGVLSFIASILLTEKERLLFLPRAQSNLQVFRYEFDPPYFYFFSNAQGKEFVCFQREKREADRVDFSVPWDAWLIDQQEGCTDTWNFAFDPTRTEPLLPQDKVGIRFLCRTPQYDQVACRARIEPGSSAPSENPVEPVDQPTPTAGQEPAPTVAQPTPVAQGCFFLTAEVYADCSQADKTCRFSTHIKFNSTGGDGDIRLERDGIHTAGWNSWNKSEKPSFNYEPRWTGGDILVRPGESKTHTWTGYATACGAEGMGIRNITCTFRNYQGQPIVEGENCFAKNFRNYIIDEPDESEEQEVPTQQPTVPPTATRIPTRLQPKPEKRPVVQTPEPETQVVQENKITGCAAPDGKRYAEGGQICGPDNLAVYRCRQGQWVEDRICADPGKIESSVGRCMQRGESASCTLQTGVCSAFFCKAPDEAVRLFTRFDGKSFFVTDNLKGCLSKTDGFEYKRESDLQRFCAAQTRDIQLLINKDIVFEISKDIDEKKDIISFWESLSRKRRAKLVVIGQEGRRYIRLAETSFDYLAVDLSEADNFIRVKVRIELKKKISIPRSYQQKGYINRLMFVLDFSADEDLNRQTIFLGSAPFPEGEKPFIEFR